MRNVIWTTIGALFGHVSAPSEDGTSPVISESAEKRPLLEVVPEGWELKRTERHHGADGFGLFKDGRLIAANDEYDFTYGYNKKPRLCDVKTESPAGQLALQVWDKLYGDQSEHETLKNRRLDIAIDRLNRRREASATATILAR